MRSTILRYRLVGKAFLLFALAGSSMAQTAPRSGFEANPASTPVPEKFSPHSVIKGSATPPGGRTPGRLIAPTTGPITDGGQASNQFGRKVGAFSSTDPDGEAPAFMAPGANMGVSTTPVYPSPNATVPVAPSPATGYQVPASPASPYGNLGNPGNSGTTPGQTVPPANPYPVTPYPANPFPSSYAVPYQGAGPSLTVNYQTLPPPEVSQPPQRGETPAKSPFATDGKPRTAQAAPSPSSLPSPIQRYTAPGFNGYEQSAAIDEIFRALSNRPQGVGVNIWFPGVAQYSNNELAQGSAVAQGIALRAGYAALNVTSVPNILPGRFNVAIGTVAQLGGLVTESELKGNAIGHLILRPMANRPDTYLLLVTGRTKEGVDSAILSLGLARQPLPRTSTAAINDIILPEAPPFLRREPLWANSIYTFEHLQAIGTQMVMLPSRRLRIEFMLPGDFSSEYLGDMQLHFHLSEAALAGSEHGRVGSVSIIANNYQQEPCFGEVFPIGGDRGTIVGAQAMVGVPARLLQVGYNFIEVDFPGASLNGFRIYSDSKLTVPSWNTQPTLPNLFITSRTAYPFVGQPDGSEILVYAVGGEIEAFESTWTFLARIAQISNTMFYNTEYQVGDPQELAAPNPQARHIIAVGTIGRIPEEYKEGMPKDLFGDPAPPPQVALNESNLPKKGVNLKDLIMRGKEAFLAYGAPSPSPAAKSVTDAPLVSLQPRAPKNERGFLGNFPPKKNTHGWVLVLSAETGPLLKRRTDELVLPQFWDRLSGGTIYWNDTPESLQVYVPPKPPVTPLQSLLPGTEDNRFVEMPLGEKIETRHWMIAVGITLLVLVLSTARTLRRITDARDYSTEIH